MNKLPETAIDLSLIADLCKEDSETAKKMFQLFLKNTPATIAEMQTYCSEENWKKLYQTAHHIKSSLSIIQIPELLTLIQNIEWNAKKQTNLHSLTAQTQQIALLYQHIEPQVQQAFKTIITQ